MSVQVIHVGLKYEWKAMVQLDVAEISSFLTGDDFPSVISRNFAPCIFISLTRKFQISVYDYSTSSLAWNIAFRDMKSTYILIIWILNRKASKNEDKVDGKEKDS